MRSIESYISQAKQDYDAERSHQTLSRLRLPEGCTPRFKLGTGILEIICDSKDLVNKVWRDHRSLLPYIRAERITVKSECGSSELTAATDSLVNLWDKDSQGAFMNGNGIKLNRDPIILRAAERIYNNTNQPMALVSLETHTNLHFNQCLIEMMGAPPKELRTRNLKLHWLSPEELHPSVYSQYLTDSRLPSQMEQMEAKLRQQSTLPAERYRGWLGNDYGIWTSDIEIVEMQDGEWGRLMTTLDFQPLR